MNHELQTVTRPESNDGNNFEPNASVTKLEAGEFDENPATADIGEPSYTPEEERRGKSGWMRSSSDHQLDGKWIETCFPYCVS